MYGFTVAAFLGIASEGIVARRLLSGGDLGRHWEGNGARQDVGTAAAIEQRMDATLEKRSVAKE